MIADLIYIAICCYTMTVIGCQGYDENARNSLFVIVTAVHAIFKVLSGAVIIPVDAVSFAVAIFAAWVALSLLWTDTKKSRLEAATWLCYLYLFMVCRQYPMDLLCWAIVPLGSILAALQVYRRISGVPVAGAEYAGNSNHNAAYLIIVTIIGLWMSLNISPLAFVPTVISGVAVGMSKCRAGGIALLCGLIVMQSIAGGIYAGLWWAAAIVVSARIIATREDWAGKARTASQRIMFYSAALSMIAKRPLQGWGLNMYRKLLPDFYSSPKSAWFRKVSARTDGKEGTTTHRVHNDHLEIMVELGVVGYLLFAEIFYFIPSSPILWTLLVTMAVMATAFFPLREVHMAAPFWVAIGAISGGVPVAIAIPTAVQIIAVAVSLAAICLAVTVLISLCFYNVAIRAKTPEEKAALLKGALRFDPYNTTFLATAVATMWNVDPFLCGSYLDRATKTYDGSVKKWELEAQVKAFRGNHAEPV
jgi:hypothetical protein